MTKVVGICLSTNYYSSEYWRDETQHISWDYDLHGSFYMLFAGNAEAVKFRLTHPELTMQFVDDEHGALERLIVETAYAKQESQRYYQSGVRLTPYKRDAILMDLAERNGWVPERLIADDLATECMGLTPYEWRNFSQSELVKRQRRKAGWAYQLSKAGLSHVDGIRRQRQREEARRKREQERAREQAEHEALMARVEAHLKGR